MHCAEAGDHCIGKRLNGCRQRNVRDDTKHTQLVRRAFERVSIEIRDRDLHAKVAQLAREGLADTRGTSRDDGDTMFQNFVHRLDLRSDTGRACGQDGR